MEIKVYPIRSDLSHDNDINAESKNLIEKLKNELKADIDIEEDIDNLYSGDLSLILVQTGGSESKFLDILPHLKAPIYLLTYGSNNSLAASIEILSYLKKHKIAGEVLHGDPSYIAKRIKLLWDPETNFGLFGMPSDWLISSIVDPTRVKEKFNVNIIPISNDELIEEYNKVEDNEVILDEHEFNKEEKIKAGKVTIAINKISEKYHLDGMTIRCFDLLTTIKTTACLALAQNNARGFVSACEGDVPTMLSMNIAKRVLSAPAFQANPSRIEVKDNTMILAHCTLPLSMCESYKFDTHFESNIGLGIKGELKEGHITVFKIAADLSHYFVSEGEILENLSRSDLCRTQIRIKLDKSVSYFLTNPLGNHHIIVYGHHQKEIEEYLIAHGLRAVNY